MTSVSLTASPSEQRWLNRDPAGEIADVNLSGRLETIQQLASMLGGRATMFGRVTAAPET